MTDGRAAAAPSSLLDATAREASARFGDRPAVVAPDGRTLTYRQLDRVADEVADGLAAAGVEPGDVVGLVLPAGPEYVVAYLAASRLGVVTAGVNPRLPVPDRAAILRSVGSAVVLGAPTLLDGVDVRATTYGIRVDRPIDRLLGELRGAPPRPVVPADPDRPVAIVFTSGTTGPPKGVVFTDRQLDAIRRIDHGEGWGGGGDMLVSTEPVHVGFMTKLVWYLRRGLTMHQLRHWRAADALRVIADHRIRSVGGIPAQIALMLREPELERYDLSAVETIVTGGGPVTPRLIDEASRRFGAGFSVRYSSTESGGVGTGTDPDDLDEGRRTVGRPRPGVQVAIVDQAGSALPAGEVGTVALRSGAVMAGYWQDPDGTAATLVEGWLRTGDLGRLDADGRLCLAGRRSDVYIRGGYNVHPQRVEAVLDDHPAVAAVAVTARPDPVMGEVGVAVVVPVEGRTPPTLDELRTHAAGSLAAHELPEDVLVVRDLPRTSLHKLDRARLRELVSGVAG